MRISDWSPDVCSSDLIHLHQGYLPDGVDLGDVVAIDTETMGLNLARDRLCLIQLSAGDGVCHAVQIPAAPAGTPHAAPNLARMLSDPLVVKLFHFARFDIAALRHTLGITCQPVYCTKIARSEEHTSELQSLM